MSYLSSHPLPVPSCGHTGPGTSTGSGELSPLLSTITVLLYAGFFSPVSASLLSSVKDPHCHSIPFLILWSAGILLSKTIITCVLVIYFCPPN
jgi:hypothetical protein